MNIIVLGAFGNAGRTIVAEAEKRGHHVLAVATANMTTLHFLASLSKVHWI